MKQFLSNLFSYLLTFIYFLNFVVFFFFISVGTKEGGSITQGTPVHPFAVDKRGAPMYDYHRTIRHSPSVTTSNVSVQPSNSGVVVSHGQSSSSQYNSYPSRQASSYTIEQLSSRQIIMNDYITSQQMHPRNRSGGSAEVPSKSETPATIYCANTPPPQGVIQRHNTQKHYAPPPPGLEAFSSLVDVAVQQPSLPVPHAPPPSGPSSASAASHEGLCMSIERIYGDRYGVDNRSMPRMGRQQYQMAVAMEQREREIMIKEEQEQQQRAQKEQIERLHQREKEIQQEHNRIAQQQREKEFNLQQQHYRLVQHNQHRENLAAAAAVAAQRDKEHQEQHRLAVQQREKEIQHQKREKEIQAQQFQQQQQQHQQAYLQQQQQHQQRYKTQQMQHMQQQQQHRMEAEQQRRNMVPMIYKDQHEAASLYRECDSPASVKSGAYYQPSRLQQQPQQQQQPPQQSSRHMQQPSQQQQPTDSSSITAASLIDAIITHQINVSDVNSNQPTRPGDRLFQVCCLTLFNFFIFCAQRKDSFLNFIHFLFRAFTETVLLNLMAWLTVQLTRIIPIGILTLEAAGMQAAVR